MQQVGQTQPSSSGAQRKGHERAALRGAALLVATRVGGHLTQLVALVVIARLLGPDDYGVVAMVVAATALFSVFADLGLSLVTVQRPNITDQQLSTLFWVNVAFGCLLGLLTLSSGPVLTWFYNDGRLTDIAAVIAIAFPLGALGVQQQALLKRRMQFGRFAGQRFASTVGSAVTGIWLAYAGWGYWALVWQHVIFSAVGTVLSWLMVPWRPGWPRRCEGLGQMLGFGGRLSAHGLVGYFSMNLDKLLIGRFCGSVALGLYAAAYRLMMRPIAIAALTVGEAAIPAMSRDAEAGRSIRESYYRMLRVTCLLGFPVCLWGAVWAQPVVMTLLGSQWMQMVTILRVLFLAGLANMVGATTGWVFVASGRPDRMLRWGIVWTGITAAAFLSGLPFGVAGVAAAYAAANWLALPLWLAYAYRPTDIRLTEALRISSWPLVCSALACLVSVLAGWVLLSSVGPGPSKLLLQVCGAAVCYLALVAATVGPIRDIVASRFVRLAGAASSQRPYLLRLSSSKQVGKDMAGS